LHDRRQEKLMTKKPQFSDAEDRRGMRTLSTRDHDLIRQWAERHKAEPATGEQTSSGPATVNVNDGGAGIRFNFPGVARFRPISWDEWFDNFDAHGLLFVYEQEVADRAYEYFQARGGEHGHDKDDWLEAERDLDKPAISSARYRLVKEE
jgi:hypothetical protein